MKLEACYTHPVLGEMVTLEDAEAERDALRAEVAELREALREIKGMGYTTDAAVFKRIARAALSRTGTPEGGRNE